MKLTDKSKLEIIKDWQQKLLIIYQNDLSEWATGVKCLAQTVIEKIEELEKLDGEE